MNFLYPYFLLGLIAIAIPIIIHLFNFQKYKVIYFSNLQFLQNLQVQTKKLSNIKRLIILILRILIITSIVFAFAHPFFSNNNIKKTYAKNAVCVFIDNSFSMQSVGEDNKLIFQATNTAKQIAMSYAPDDKFLLITNDLLAEQFRLLNRDEFISKLDDINTQTVSKKMSEIFPRIFDVLESTKNYNKHTYIISDAQKSAFDFSQLQNDSTVNVRLVALKNEKNKNISIDSCWFDVPVFRKDQNISLKVVISNYNNEDIAMLPISLKINGEEIASAIAEVKANSISTVSLNFVCSKIGLQQAEIKINDNGEIGFDDSFYLSFEIKNSVNVLELFENKTNKYINSIYETDSIFNFTSIDIKSVNFSQLNEYDFIILSEISNIASGTTQEIIKYTKQGGVVCFIPNNTINSGFTSINQFLTETINCKFSTLDSLNSNVALVNILNPLYKNVFEDAIVNVDFPFIKNHYSIISSGVLQPLVNLTNKDVIFGVAPLEQGLIFVFGIAPDDFFGNFHKHPIIVPTFLNMAFSNHLQNTLYAIIGNNEMVRLRKFSITGDDVINAKSEDGKFEFIPQIIKSLGEIHLFDNNQIQKSGNYKLLYKNQVISGISYNYNRVESNMDFISESELENLFKQNNLSNFSILPYNEKISSSEITKSISEFSLWKYFIILALVFLLFEVFLIRFWKIK